MEHPMAGAIRNFGSCRVWLCATEGPPITSEADALDVIGATYGSEADWIAIPVERLPPDFFRLRTGLAGAILQKLVNYHFRVAIVGDVGEAVARSEAFADYVVESNRGADVWFIADEAALEARLAALP